MADCSDYPTSETSKLFKSNARTVDEFVTSDSVLTSPASDGEQKRTLAGIQADANSAIASASSAYLDEWRIGLVFNAHNEYAVYNGVSYKIRSSTTVPYVTQSDDPTVFPDASFVEPFSGVNTGNITLLVEPLVDESISNHNSSTDAHPEITDRTNVQISSHNDDPNAHLPLSNFITAEANRAEVEADRATAAAAEALNSAEIYASINEGLTSTVSGEYFSVTSLDVTSYLDLYLNDSGVAVYINTYPSSALVSELQEYSNKVSGNDDSSIDVSSGEAIVALQENSEKSMSFATLSDGDIGGINTVYNEFEFPMMSTNVMNVQGGTMISDPSGCIVELPFADDALVFADTFGGYFAINTVTKSITTTYSIQDNISTVETRKNKFTPIITDDVTNPLYILSSRNYQAIPTVVRTDNGRMWMSWRADDFNGEAPGNYFVIASSEDMGVTSTERYIVTYSDTDTIQITGQSLWIDDNGVMWMFWTSFQENAESEFSSQQQAWAITIKNPDADPSMISFSKPFRINPYGIPREPKPVNEGHYIMVDYWNSVDGITAAYPEYSGGNVFKLNASNRSLEYVSKLPTNTTSGNRVGFFESQIIQKKDGSFLAVQRDPVSNGLLYTLSEDAIDWTPFQTYSALGNPSGRRVWLGLLSSGRMAIAYNNSIDGKQLTLSISEDDGVTFPYSVLIEPDQSQGATQAMLSINGDSILVIYDFGRETSAQIRTAQILESEVISGTSIPVNHTISDPK